MKIEISNKNAKYIVHLLRGRLAVVEALKNDIEWTMMKASGEVRRKCLLNKQELNEEIKELKELINLLKTK